MDALDLDILGPALVAGLLILATHVPLGMIVLNRGIIFIDIALAQVAALGVVFASLMWGASSIWIVQLCAVAAAIGCSAILTWTDRHWPDIQEAIIGVVYILAAAAQIILLAYGSNGAEQLKALMVGQILRVTPLQLVVVAAIYAIVLAVWFFRDLVRERHVFYAVFAIVITASVQIVGVLLVVASLIVPAMAARHAPPGWRLAIAFNVGVVGYLAGLLASAVLDLPTGAAILVVLIPVALVAAILIGRARRPVGTGMPGRRRGGRKSGGAGLGDLHLHS